MSDHVWAQENLTSYLAGGLSTTDRLRLQEHAAACAECREGLASLEGLDRTLRSLFAGMQPPVTLEDRTIRALRRAEPPAVRRQTWSWPMKGMLAAAALFLLIGTGAFLSSQMTMHSMTASFPYQIGLATEEGPTPQVDAAGEVFRTSDLDLAAEMIQDLTAIERGQKWGWRDNALDAGLKKPDASEKANVAGTPSPSGGAGVPDVKFGVQDGRRLHEGAAQKARELDRLATPPAIHGSTKLFFGQRGTSQNGAVPGTVKPSDAVGIANEDRRGGLAQLPSPGASGSFFGRSGATAVKEEATKSSTWFGTADRPGRPEAKKESAPQSEANKSGRGRMLGGVPGGTPQLPALARPAEPQLTAPPPPTPPVTLGVIAAPGFAAPTNADKAPSAGTAGGAGYFRPTEGLREALARKGQVAPLDDKLGRRDGETKKQVSEMKRELQEAERLDDKKADLADKSTRSEERLLADLDRPLEQLAQKTDPKAKTLEKTDPKAAASTSLPPAQAPLRKIIIRSGDIEFEVDSFDLAVSTIFRLINKTAGGFVATVNSEKLANGKMRGTVTIRTPPETLDDFVLELRQQLAKMGELKGQRIGSQDVTKHYTDLEGELRAARTMEERYLKMIAEGKGALKDLLAVEKDLGVWRTKIEKLEGELRYYGNLASLSTLTITLTEKEIRTAASLTETERVQAGLEVEEVEKAYQDAQAAVLELKGRITRAEMKQHAAGQFNAILVFEIAPESSGPMRDRLRQLGNMVRLEIDRVTKVEGTGTFPKDGKESKVRRGDSQFTVSLYNLANVAPRETTTLTLVTADVPESYRKLRDAIGKLKAQVRNAQLQEQDRARVNAQIDVDVRRLDEPTLQAALAAAGEVLTRKVDRRADAENVTDSKVMFRIHLISTAAIEPRETVKLTVAVEDVLRSFQKLQDVVLLTKSQGHIRNASMQEGDRQKMTGQVDFDVARAEVDHVQKVLTEIGETVSKSIDRRQSGDNLTDAKVLYQVRLVSETSIEARQVTRLALAVPDVAATYRKLFDQVQQLKGLVRNANLLESDRQNISATLEFIVRRTDEAVLQAAIGDAGEVLSRQVDRRPEGENVTDAKVMFTLDIRSAGTIAPRKTYTVALEVANVHETLKTLNESIKAAGGKIDGPQVQDNNDRVLAKVVYDVPLPMGPALAEQIKASGKVRKQDVAEDSKAPEGKLAIAKIFVVVTSEDRLVPRDEGLLAQMRTGLSFSVRGLLLSASWLLAAVVFLLPWALVVWVAVRLFRRTRGETTPPPPAS